MPCFHNDFSPSAEQSDKYSLGKDGCFKVSNSTHTCQFCCGEVFNFLFRLRCLRRILPYKSIKAKLCQGLPSLKLVLAIVKIYEYSELLF